MRPLFISIVGFSAFLLSASFAMSQTSPYFLVYPVTAVSPDRGEDGTFPPITWLPAQTLLFELSNQSPLRDYTAATTQDGVRVLIYNPTRAPNISAAPLIGSTAFPDISVDLVVFHSEYVLCRTISCEKDQNNPEAQLVAQPGYVGRIAEIREDIGFVRIELTVIQTESGWISMGELSRLIDSASVTRINLYDNSFVHPHFDVSEQVSDSLSTPCNGVWGAGDDLTYVAGQFQPFEFELIRRFQLAEVQPERLINLRSFGGPGQRWEYRVYTFNSRVDDSELVFYTLIKYACEQVAAGGGTISTIDEIVLLGPEGRIILEPLGTPEGLRRLPTNNISDAYLWSVNTNAQYFQLMGALFSKFKNRAVAGYFLGEFSRACPGAIRATAVCTSHSYPGGNG